MAEAGTQVVEALNRLLLARPFGTARPKLVAEVKRAPEERIETVLHAHATPDLLVGLFGAEIQAAQEDPQRYMMDASVEVVLSARTVDTQLRTFFALHAWLREAIVADPNLGGRAVHAVIGPCAHSSPMESPRTVLTGSIDIRFEGAP